MRKKFVIKVIAMSIAATSVAIADVPMGRSTWTYDNLFNDLGKKIGFTPGLYAPNINQYNATAQPCHTFTQVFSYGGSMEMYCQGSGGTSSTTACNASNMNVYYNPGNQSTNAYYTAASGTAYPLVMVPIVDGAIGDTYLKTFNSLSESAANTFADNVAQLYCADDKVDGVQFDLEPFDISKPGQAYFYTQIAKNFAGKHNATGPDPYNCVNANHPSGRFFSVFTNAGKVNATVATIFNQYGNGYVIDSLYDMGTDPTGVVTPPSIYQSQVTNEVIKMVSRAATFNVKYQFAIPASASAHEFESVGGVSTGYSQLQYVTSAMNAINQYARSDVDHFRGVNAWGWSNRKFYAGKEFLPNIPPSNVLAYLANNL